MNPIPLEWFYLSGSSFVLYNQRKFIYYFMRFYVMQCNNKEQFISKKKTYACHIQLFIKLYISQNKFFYDFLHFITKNKSIQKQHLFVHIQATRIQQYLDSIIKCFIYIESIIQKQQTTQKMSNIDQTLRKAREVDEKYKQFMSQKEERDKSMADTFQKLKKAQQTMKQTKQTLNKIDSIYNKIEEGFSNAIDNALKGVQTNVMFNIPDPNWKPNKINTKDFIDEIKDNKKIMFLTGAGISAASGIQTFRGTNGFWTQNSNTQGLKDETLTTPQQILTKTYYQENQFKTWQWLDNFYQMKTNAKINKGHQSLQTIIQQLLNKKCEVMLTSQNIDNFHIQAKLQHQKKNKSQLKEEDKKYQVCQIHGNITKIRCEHCTQQKKQLFTYMFQDFRNQIAQKKSPKCQRCQNKLRPHIMFFDQFYSQVLNKSQTVMNFAKTMDLVVVIGTALQTGLSRTVVETGLEKKCTIVQINIDCQIKRPGTMWMEGQADKILDKIKFQIWKNGL